MRRIRAQFLYVALVGLFFVFLSVSAILAQGTTPLFPEPPAESAYVVDLGDMITDQDELTINARADNLWQEEGIPIFVVTINSLAEQNAPDYSIERYATALFSIWGIGSAEENLGILLLVSRDDRVARIELGADWDRSYDSQAQAIMDNNIIPQFRVDAYSEGILRGVERLATLADVELSPTPRAIVPSTSSPTSNVQPTTRSVPPSNDSGSDFDCSSLFFWLLMIPVALFNWLRGGGGGGGLFGGNDGSTKRGGSNRRRSGRSFGGRSSSGRSSSSRSGGFSRGGGASGKW